ncbi:helix-turn-helix domain-containing protein [Sphingorhabdus sp. Alg231-15]|uniref:helix-turn-helix domain-containing protein n=1 Tax=Sphingorhabdus sp. Alg231-15 TaxID=1922222 RepID=UPI000D558D53
MSKQFAFDLRLARKKSGLMQRDVAQLLGVAQATLSDLENGRYRPSIEHICTLSLIYGRNFEQFFAEILGEAREQLRGRITEISHIGSQGADGLRREATLQKLEERLAAEEGSDEMG